MNTSNYIIWYILTTFKFDCFAKLYTYSSMTSKFQLFMSWSRKRDRMAQTNKIEFLMLIKYYNLYQLSAKILEGKTFYAQRNWQLNCCIQQSNWTRNWENINWISTSVYLTVYSAYAIKLCSRFLTAINEILHRVFFSFQSVSQPVLSESLATLLDVAVNFQPEVSCIMHAIVSKLCRFF